MLCCHGTNVAYILFSFFFFFPRNSGGEGSGWGKYQITEVSGEGRMERTLHQLLGLEEALEVTHLPDAREDEDDGLRDGPPQDSLVGALAGQTEALFTIPLVILLLLDLFHLIKQLAGSELQLGQFILGSNLRVVVGMFSNLDV